jgi:DNA-binding transcriptional ArsR family regulator
MFRTEAKRVSSWHVNADTMATGRFVISPLAEALACLMSLAQDAAGQPGERAWLDAHRPGYRERMDGDPVTELLLPAAMGGRWIADFITPAPTGQEPADFARELAVIRATPPQEARADLGVAIGGPLPGRLDRPDLPELVADLLDWVWTETVLPSWPRRRRTLEADVVARTRQLSQGGWAAALDDLRPGMRWLGDGRLQINAYDYPPRRISGAQLFFVPVTPRTRGWVSWAEPHRYAVVYACSGPLAEPGHPAPEALARLLGAARAGILVLLGTPVSTTQLVALTGLKLGSVGRHLKILLDAGLVQRRRAGRSVLYYRTAAGDALVAAATSG